MLHKLAVVRKDMEEAKKKKKKKKKNQHFEPKKDPIIIIQDLIGHFETSEKDYLSEMMAITI